MSSAVSLGVITLLFAMMFKWLPDADVAWRDVWVGAVVTAVLFEIGKFAIGLYIGKQGLESTFGAAASLVVLLIWVYYSSQIVLLGAEFTRAYARRHAAAYQSKPAEGERASSAEAEHDLVRSLARQSPYALVALSALAGLTLSWPAARRALGLTESNADHDEFRTFHSEFR